MRLREDEQALRSSVAEEMDVEVLRQLPKAQRSRAIGTFLERCGVKEPEAEHIALAEALVFSPKPSARASLPGGVTVCRQYNRLVKAQQEQVLPSVTVNCPGETELPELGLKVICQPAREIINTEDTFTVVSDGKIVLRCRASGDEMRLPSGTKTLKRLFIDRKIPAAHRLQIPVFADASGVLGVYGIGVNRERAAAALPALQLKIESNSGKKEKQVSVCGG